MRGGVIAYRGKSLISVFQVFFAGINKILIFTGALGAGLLFYRVLRSDIS